ncbi:hypothetical protein [Oceanobacillus locisalsi]|uniref:SMODS-associating 2TM beta-strand rich effector domain-containing protein n=1 Tax=Oceanobacillus locisalsi TaxID=546107 RepID=A0ABW3NNU2_9BACI
MFQSLFIFVVIGILNIIETVHYVQNGETFFGNPLGVIWLLWGVATISLIAFYFLRKKQQERFWKISQESFDMDRELDTAEGEYFYQMPITKLFDKMPIMIKGDHDFTFQLYFKNLWYKFLTLFQVLPASSGITVTSNQNTVKVIPDKIFRPKFYYDVYWNETFYGRLRSKGFFKEGGSKKYLNFIFTTSEEETLTIQSDYFSMETKIQDTEEKELLTAKRTYFDLAKDEKTNRRGEQHHIQVAESKLPTEILLSLYVQVMGVR